MTKLKYQNTIGAFFILLFSSLLFFFIYLVREPFIEPLSDSNFETITGLVTTGSRVWYKEGPSSVGWTHILSPTSIENKADPNRARYISYPVGYLIPIYVSSIISHTEPSVEFIRQINLSIHFLIGLFMALAGFLLLFELGVPLSWRIFFSLAAPIIIYFSPAAMYFYQSVYFADEVILLPFSLLLLLELIPNKNKRFILDTAIAIVLFYGSYTDYLFILVAFCLFAKRIFIQKNSIKTECLRILLPSFLAIIVFLIQLSIIGALPELQQRFLARTSLDNDKVFSLYDFIMTFFVRINTYFGVFGCFILFILIPASFFLKKKLPLTRHKTILSLCLICLLPCLLQIILLNNHSYIHSFSMLKFMIPISIFSILIGVFLWKNKALSICFMIGLLYFHYENIKNFSVFIEERNYSNLRLGQFIRSNTNFNDVVFSSTYKAIGGNHYDSSLVAYAEKNIYPISKLSDINTFFKNKNLSAATIALVEPTQGKKSLLSDIDFKKSAIKMQEFKTEDLILYKFSQEDFNQLMNKN